MPNTDEQVLEAVDHAMAATAFLNGEERAYVFIERMREAGWDFVSTTDHFVDIGPKDFAIQHATFCRPNMLDCEYHHAANEVWDEKPAPNGRYRMALVKHGGKVRDIELEAV